MLLHLCSLQHNDVSVSSDASEPEKESDWPVSTQVGRETAWVLCETWFPSLMTELYRRLLCKCQQASAKLKY